MLNSCSSLETVTDSSLDVFSSLYLYIIILEPIKLGDFHKTMHLIALILFSLNMTSLEGNQNIIFFIFNPEE